MTKNYPPAVIVGLNDAALSIVRSLGRKGIRIIGLYDENSKRYYINSKYVSIKLKTPLSDEPLVDALINDVASNIKEIPILFCTSDSTVLTVSHYEDRLRPYFKFVLPPYEVTSTQISKRRFYEFAVENSFLVPGTFFTNGIEDIENAIGRLTYPCIIKPEYRDKIWSEKVPLKVLYAESKQEFMNLIKQYELQQIPLVIQEWIEGDDAQVYFCLAYISRDRKPLALCVGRKLLQYPRLTGSTSIAETILIPEITIESIRLLAAAGCIGFCSVEFKRSQANGRFYITEPTVGRPDTQEGIFVSSGIDAPYLAYLDAIGEDPGPLAHFKEKIKWINEPLALYNFQNFLRNGSDIRGFVSMIKGKRTYAIWASDDVRPAFKFLNEKVIKGCKKLFKKTAGVS